MRRISQAAESWARAGKPARSFVLLDPGGKQSTVDHPAWDSTWPTPTEDDIDDLADLGFLRVERCENKQLSFVPSVRAAAGVSSLDPMPGNEAVGREVGCGPGDRQPTAFVSWAHGNEKWQTTVHSFVQGLYDYGIKAEVDLFHLHDPSVNWADYGPREIQTNDHVLVVVSDAYKRRWEGTEDPRKGAGAALEANALKSIFNDHRDEFLRLVKLVVLPGATQDDIPLTLKAVVQRFTVDPQSRASFEDLIRTLTAQPGFVRPRLAPIPTLPAKLPPDQASSASARAARADDASTAEEPQATASKATPGQGTSRRKRQRAFPEPEPRTQEIGASDGDHEATSAFHRGLRLEKEGDPEGAKLAYREAMDGGDRECAPAAAINLGALLEEQGDFDHAKAAYERGMRLGHPNYSPIAAQNLAEAVASEHGHSNSFLTILFEEVAERAITRALYERMIVSGDADRAAAGALALGNLLAEDGDLDGARAAYGRAIAHPEHGPSAAAELGWWLSTCGDIAGARAHYEQALQLGHPDWPAVAISLGDMLVEAADPAGARAAYEAATTSDSAKPRAEAALKLGDLLMNAGDLKMAQEAYECVLTRVAPGDFFLAASIRRKALFSLGQLHERTGDEEAARGAYRKATLDGDKYGVAEEAAMRWGDLSLKSGLFDEAEMAYRKATQLNRGTNPVPWRKLGDILGEHGDMEAAHAAYREARKRQENSGEAPKAAQIKLPPERPTFVSSRHRRGGL